MPSSNDPLAAARETYEQHMENCHVCAKIRGNCRAAKYLLRLLNNRRRELAGPHLDGMNSSPEEPTESKAGHVPPAALRNGAGRVR